MASPRTDRDRIVDAALAILASDGCDAVSLRNVAQAVGVTAPSLRRHVADKRGLLAAMTERLLTDVADGLPSADRWQDWLRKSRGCRLWPPGGNARLPASDRRGGPASR